jgi:hypothetical protein
LLIASCVELPGRELAIASKNNQVHPTLLASPGAEGNPEVTGVRRSDYFPDKRHTFPETPSSKHMSSILGSAPPAANRKSRFPGGRCIPSLPFGMLTKLVGPNGADRISARLNGFARFVFKPNWRRGKGLMGNYRGLLLPALHVPIHRGLSDPKCSRSLQGVSVALLHHLLHVAFAHLVERSW